MEKWMRKGSILNQNKGNSGPKRSVGHDENITSVEARIIQESSQSVRRIAAELGINRESVRRIFKKGSRFKNLTNCRLRNSFLYRQAIEKEDWSFATE